MILFAARTFLNVFAGFLAALFFAAFLAVTVVFAVLPAFFPVLPPRAFVLALAADFSEDERV
jgi:hypothetical protein